MAAALITAIVLSIGGLAVSGVLGLLAATPQDVFRHTSLAIFSTLVNLLSHSMMMFYLIGKGRAVRDAMTEGGLSGDHDRQIARVRVPVFSWATYAMAATIVTALLGASVDTRVAPGWVHAGCGLMALTLNLLALKREVTAITTSARVVGEVNRLLGF